ncbi:hypothetical protein GGS26DRAFT_309871 [Hypomontagnella submonticulosa]|nr:hypothetical protein GGS26DRAFT_309871 [Hypomontagnella submonticulosa]
MASRNAKERRFVPPPELAGNATETGIESEVVEGGRRKRRKRDANVYDAVAGRVTTTLPLDDGSGSEAPSHHFRTSRDRHRDPTLAPEEVLFRRIGAPVRFAEKDIYQAHEALRDGGRGVLPDSDMLKAIHSYASHFYTALARRGGGSSSNSVAVGRNIDERSMDETALLALGILVEEAGREALGRSGDLVFTEGVAQQQIERNGEEEEPQQQRQSGDDAETVDFKASMTGKW